jgi:catechol 2,3-dioxygenase-like lactoylglutathione lyase family enzyme
MSYYSVGMIDHVTMQVDDVQRSRAFYEGVLAPLGIAALAVDGDAVGFFGPSSGGFWLCPGGGTETRELHVAFTATSRSQVREFHCAAVNLGAEVLHGPQVFDQYDPDYFAAFVRDPDGHNIEAVCRLTGE